MIVVRVELWSSRTGARTEIARMRIANIGEGAQRGDKVGDYKGSTFRGLSAAALDRGETVAPTRTGKVLGFRRHDQHVWNLVALMLSNMGYGR